MLLLNVICIYVYLQSLYRTTIGGFIRSRCIEGVRDMMTARKCVFFVCIRLYLVCISRIIASRS